MILAPDLATAEDLLAGYPGPASFFFASPRGAFRTDGAYLTVPPSLRPDAHADLPGRVAAALGLARAAGHESPIAVGAIPFAPTADAALVIPERVRRAAPLAGPDAAPPDDPRPPAPPYGPADRGAYRVEEVPGPGEYAEAVRRAVARIEDGELRKVVLSRALRVVARGGHEIGPLVAALAGRDPRAYTFAADLGGGRTLLGASPELLVTRTGGKVVANPLAGSAPRSADPEEDRRRAEALLASAKDRHEHALVVDAVADALRPLCTALDVPAEPELIRTAAMWHLSTVVEGVAAPGVTSLALATALHPTPAVCGTPVEAARTAIAELEPYDRGFYTGMVGWEDADGDGEWVVTIRCGVAEGDRLDLYAGAGIVGASDPAAEVAETGAKFRTMLTALGLETADAR
ncbi:isochorismate synthase [Bailinhaonella thermotolerans]|uniref:isochorismate synthase n=1 Tax=Bailinhaonella thermotolerans TaxID=1070861 RepID=A0A3A4AP81_9ACTN|nr:isochorismate synthase [Bailinhaonella thermotolerans]RJL30831.1 isochorismate synthase [Bailinhaonella thermotolerans]